VSDSAASAAPDNASAVDDSAAEGGGDDEALFPSLDRTRKLPVGSAPAKDGHIAPASGALVRTVHYEMRGLTEDEIRATKLTSRARTLVGAAAIAAIFAFLGLIMSLSFLVQANRL
jgi:hypothetical protein